MPAPSPRTSRTLTALILALALAACGARGDPTVVEGTPGGSPPEATDDSPGGDDSPSPPESVAPTRTRLPESPVAEPGAVDIDRDLIPEYTTYYSPRFEQVTMNGVNYPSTMVLYAGEDPERVEINAGRRRDRFTGKLSIPDTQSSESAFQVDISMDGGPPVYSTLVRFGETKDIDLDVTDVLRIRITVVSVGRRDGRLGIGNPRFS